MEIPFAELAKKVGVVRNEILAFSIVIFAVINIFNSYEFLSSNDHFYHIAGFVIMCASLAFPFSAFGFYIYAFFRLPISTQEYVFAQAGERQIREHKQIQKTGKRAKENISPEIKHDE